MQLTSHVVLLLRPFIMSHFPFKLKTFSAFCLLTRKQENHARCAIIWPLLLIIFGQNKVSSCQSYLTPALYNRKTLLLCVLRYYKLWF